MLERPSGRNTAIRRAHARESGGRPAPRASGDRAGAHPSSSSSSSSAVALVVVVPEATAVRGGGGGGGTEPLLTLSTIVSPGSAVPRGTLADDGARVRPRCRPCAPSPSSRPAPALARASFSAAPTTSGTRDSAPPSRNRVVGRRQREHRLAVAAAASSCRTRSRPGSCRRRCCRCGTGTGSRRRRRAAWGELELSKVITAPAICGTNPRNAADLCCWVVPVLPAIGRFQPTCAGRARRRAAAAGRPCSAR